MKESILKEFEEKFVKPTDSGWEIENKLAVFYIDYIDAKSFISQALDRVEKEALIKWTTDFMKCDYARVIADQTRQETIQRCIEVIEKVEIEVKIYKKKSVS